jgi:eukaryotic-like serine/threonine-protein kinase
MYRGGHSYSSCVLFCWLKGKIQLPYSYEAHVESLTETYTILMFENQQIKLTQTWTIGREISRGGFGRVHEAMGSDPQPYVIKFVPKQPGADRELLLAEYKGRNIVPILDKGDWNDYLVMVMPRAEQSLRQHINNSGGKLDLPEAITILKHIAEGLASLERDVVHRDIKPENILYWDGKWCLADFGIARYAEATTAIDTHKYSFTPLYAAPEQWRSERATPATDIYAFGIIGYEILSGNRPFSGHSEHELRNQHLHTNPPALSGTPSSISALIFECLYKSAEARPTAANLLARLQKAQQPINEAINPLLMANLQVVQEEAESELQLSIRRTEAEKRNKLFEIAKHSLSNILQELRLQILQIAPKTKSASHALSYCELNGAILEFESINQIFPESLQSAPFDIIASGGIKIRISPNQYEYEGRAHSLWYCDAQEIGVYRWYEFAFGIMSGRRSVYPFSLTPGEQSFMAFNPALSSLQLARPVTPIDQGDEENFMNRWIHLFGEAALGNLQSPSQMPEAP